MKNIKINESRRNAGQEAYGSKLPESGLQEGIKVESEHAEMITWLKRYLTETGKFPTDQEIFAKIAEAHLTESPDYYKELAKMENINTTEHRKHTPITSQQQADFFGAELGRKKRGEKGETDMSIDELERHLREWSGKKNEVKIVMTEETKEQSYMENKPTDIEISNTYGDVVKSGITGDAAMAATADKLGITKDNVLNARDRVMNPSTVESRRNMGRELYGK